MQALLATTRAWYLGQTAVAFAARGALAGLWMADKNATGIAPELYRRCWPYHLAMKPFYHCTPQIWNERATYAMIGFWKLWLRRQLRASTCPPYAVAQAIMGFATELFDHADQKGALKVVDCPNSHPTSYYGYWQRECDLWCPGERVPIPQWMFARMNRELERADVILCPSVFVRDTMVTNGIPDGKCFVCPFGVNTGVFQPRPCVPDKPLFISVGNVCVRKGHQYLFRAFDQVKRAYPQAELVCVGEYKCDFRRERGRWAGQFTHHDRLDHPTLAKLLQKASAFVLASVEEGFARVLSEAMAAGLPIVATYETGATTLARDGVQGFIVPARRPDLLAEAMCRVIADPQLNERMGRASHAAGAARNTWQDYGDRLLAEYEARRTARAH